MRCRRYTRKGKMERWRKVGGMEGGKGECTCYLSVVGKVRD